MDDIDKELLNMIQSDFPVCVSPYRVLGERLNITKDDVFYRVKALVDSGIIRRIGASFDTRRLGHSSILVAAKVAEDKLEEVAAQISSFPEVTHNYGRNFEYNLWFTLVCESPEQICSLINDIKSINGIIEIHALPSERMFKIKVDFEF